MNYEMIAIEKEGAVALEDRGQIPCASAGFFEEGIAALRRKYGWQMRLGDFFARLSGRYQRRVLIELVL